MFGKEGALAVAAYPDYADHQRKTDRPIPAFGLGLVGDDTPAGR